MQCIEMLAILQGRVKICVFSEDGKEVIFAILESGDFFGENALLDGLPGSATCTAIEDCRLVVIARDSFIPFLEQHPPLAIHLLALLIQRLRSADGHMEDAALFSLTVRLARKLLALAAEDGDKVGDKVEIAMNISQHEWQHGFPEPGKRQQTTGLMGQRRGTLAEPPIDRYRRH